MAKAPKPSAEPIVDTAWMADAKCGGLSAKEAAKFFDSGDTIKGFCSDCPVKGECLDYALITEAYGVWGGMSKKAREKKYPSYIRDAMREDLELTL